MSDVEAFTEYGWYVEYGDGTRGWLTPLGTDRDRALAQFRMLEADMPEGTDEMRLVFVSRHVTRTPWTAEDAPAVTTTVEA
ncbi:hypothetical protein [Kitasatospora sp. NBC_01302]|uniref:hypothetical protein n=1 Tax=Kitasatospora sp. NBC_01302 TaxID=2903575 RepID=UPI002E0F9FBD|nr:hypothetical protein OG294_14095 [Kitasatospora sp. NBC_01302]